MSEEPPTELAPSMAANTLTVIGKAAENPDVDVEKMERLLEMQERIIAKEAESTANRALFAFKRDCPQLKKSRAISVQGRVRSQYCGYEDMMKQVRPLMTQYGFAERFDTHVDERGKISAVTCTIVHESGHSWTSTFPVEPDQSGSKNTIQAIGSALSYGKRYSFASAMGIVTTDEDDDGQSSVPDEVPDMVPAGNAKAKKEVEAEIVEPDSDRESLEQAVAVMIDSDGIETKWFNAAVDSMTKGKFKTFLDLPTDRLSALATDTAFAATVKEANRIKENA